MFYGKWTIKARADYIFLLRLRQQLVFYEARFLIEETLNPELCKKALEKVGNPNVLINLVSRRVRQLNSGGGSSSRPMVADIQGMGAADVALLEIIEEKMGWELPELAENERPTNGKKKTKKH